MNDLTRDAILFCFVHLYLSPFLFVSIAIGAWWYSTLAGILCAACTLIYVAISYDGSEVCAMCTIDSYEVSCIYSHKVPCVDPQHRSGRPWAWWARFPLFTHSYFPVEIRMWNGHAFTSDPEPAHASVYDLHNKPHVFA